jgi:hypothetical protein
MVLSFLFFAFLAYLAWKLVFNLIIPIYRTTRRVRQGIREMQEQMRQATGEGPQPANRPNGYKVSGENGQSTTARPNKGDYIDFEEVK